MHDRIYKNNRKGKAIEKALAEKKISAYNHTDLPVGVVEMEGTNNGKA